MGGGKEASLPAVRLLLAKLKDGGIVNCGCCKESCAGWRPLYTAGTLGKARRYCIAAHWEGNQATTVIEAIIKNQNDRNLFRGLATENPKLSAPTVSRPASENPESPAERTERTLFPNCTGKYPIKRIVDMVMQLKESDRVTQIGMPSMGVYGGLLRKSIGNALKKIGITNVKLNLAPPITRKTINRGAQYMDENMCLPAKILLGSIIELYERGNEIVVEWDNCGDCRQKTYCLVHQSILRQLGINVKVLAAQPKNITGWLLEIIPDLPRRKQRQFVHDVLRDLWKFDMRLMEKQASPPKGMPKIGICGEIYTVLEPAANLGLISRLEEQGAYVHNALPLSQFVFHQLLGGKNRAKWAAVFAYLGMFDELKNWCVKKMKRPDVDYALFHKAKEVTEKYFPKRSIGGHGKESVTWAIYYAMAGFDGIVHIMPFPCMPEATVTALVDEVSRDYGIPVNHLVFDQQFGEQNLITRAEAMVNLLRFKKEGLESTLATRRPGFWLGLDVGSTSTKSVLLDGETLEIVDHEYQFTNREPINAIKRVVTAIISRHPDKKIIGGATTGSGRRLAKALLDAPLAVDEISCQVMGCMLIDPSVCSIIEIGGQDSKFVSLDQFGVPCWFNMNSICSAGTGAFLSSAAREFKVPIEKLGTCARSAECAVVITGRCGVFAESDIVSKQQAGYPVNSIVKGMCKALAQNYLSNVCRSKTVGYPIMFTGAVALNGGVVDAFSELTGQEVRVHPNQRVSGALGAAFMALVRNAVGGFDGCKTETQFGSYTFNCHDCSNECEVSLIHRDNCVVCALGSRCGKYEKFAGQNLNAVKTKIGNDRNLFRGLATENPKLSAPTVSRPASENPESPAERTEWTPFPNWTEGITKEVKSALGS